MFSKQEWNPRTCCFTGMGALNHGTINDRFLKTFYIETELDKKVKLSE